MEQPKALPKPGALTIAACLLLSSVTASATKPEAPIDTSHLKHHGLERIVTVAKSGGDYSNLQSAIASITDASQDKPYLIYVAPGRYPGPIFMKPYVSIEGAGLEETKIIMDDDSEPAVAAVQGAPATELRHLSVFCTTRYWRECNGIYHVSDKPAVPMRLIHVRVAAYKYIGTGTTHAIRNLARMSLEHVTVESTNGAEAVGILHEGFELDLNDVAIEARMRRDFVGKGTATALRASRAVDGRGLDAGAFHAGSATAVRLEGGRFWSRLRDSRLSATGNKAFGVLLDGSMVLDVNDSELDATSTAESYAVGAVMTQNDGNATLRLFDSTVDAKIAGVLVNQGNHAHLVGTHLDSGGAAGSGNIECRFTTDGNLTAYTTGCP